MSLERINRDDSKETDLWIPYPMDTKLRRPSWLSQCFDEACKLSFIARDISRVLGSDSTDSQDRAARKEDFYHQLRRWLSDLPASFAPEMKPAPHIILLRMRYHALLINLYFDSFSARQWRRTQEYSNKSRVLQAALSSAREISALTQLHQEEYGVDSSHQFAMYAVILALFAFLEQPSFNVVDPDFCSLTSAFSTMARRSLVGVKLFRVFRHSVSYRLHSERATDFTQLPAWLRELFEDDPQILATHEADGGRGDEYAAPGIGDMLSMYEKMSLGKEDELQGLQPSEDAFRFSPPRT